MTLLVIPTSSVTFKKPSIVPKLPHLTQYVFLASSLEFGKIRKSIEQLHVDTNSQLKYSARKYTVNPN